MKRQSLKICTIDRKPICELYDGTEYRCRNISEKLSINEITPLSFELPVANPKWVNIKNENLVLFNGEYYRIKKASFFHDENDKLYVSVDCKHYSDNLANDLISIEETTPLDVISLMKIALCYDADGNPTKGWSIGEVTVDRVAKRGLEVMEQSPFSILLTIAEKYEGILKFNSQTMKVDMLARQNTDHPTIDLRVSKNLKSFEISYDTSEMFTRLYCYGATDDDGNELDIMSVNPTGKPYIDNFDYYYTLGYTEEYVAAHPELFVNTNIWRDDNYYDAQSLYNDGIKELAKIAQPVVDVKVVALDTRVIGIENKITDLELGSCIRIYDEDLGVDTLCNVISREINYEELHILNMQVTNSVVYHDTLSKLFTNVSTASSVVTSGGNLVGGQGTSMSTVQAYLATYYLNAEQIDAKYIDAETLEATYLTAEQIKATYLDANAIAATYATIGSLNAIEAQIRDLDVDELSAKLADIEDLTADLAVITKFIATDAEIEELEAGNVTVVGTLKANKAEFEEAIATKLSVGDFNAYKTTTENLIATKASIQELEANYIKASQIDSTYAKITSLDAVIADVGTLNTDLANVEQLVAKKANIEDLNVVNGQITNLNTDLANVNKLLANKVDAEYVEAEIVEATKVLTDDITAINATITTLDAKYATIDALNAAKAELNTLIAKKATIEELNVAKGNISTLESLVANINSIMAGNIGTGTLQTIHLTAKNVVIDDAVIKSANIESIDTDLVTVGNDNITLSGSTQQFKDENGNVRVQIGLDAEGKFSFIICDENGATIITGSGVTENAIPDGLIVDKMVSEDAGIQASKVNYIDKDGNKTLQTVISTEQGKIDTLIKETEALDGNLTTLSDKYNKTESTVNSHTTTIGNIQTSVNTLTGEVEEMDSRITEIKTTADGVQTTVSANKDNWDNANIEIGGRNLVPSSFLRGIDDNESTKEFTLSDWGYELMGSDAVSTIIKPNSTYTFSVNVELVKRTQVPTVYEHNVALLLYSSSNLALYIMKYNNITEVGDYVEHKYTFTTPAVIPSDCRLLAYTNRYTTNGSNPIGTDTIKFTNFKLEKGNKSTDYTAAPEDTEKEITATKTIAEQTADKFTWMVKSGTNATDFTLTDRTAALVSDYINLNGLVTFFSQKPTEGSTTINGGYIQTNTINTNHLVVDEIFATGSSVMNIIDARELNADMITSGSIKANYIELYGLEVKHQTSGITTFAVDNKGEVTIRGGVESYNYISGSSGWSINPDGNAEFNNVTVRGDLINTDGGISSETGVAKTVRFWAGSSYEERESAPWTVYSDGSMVATKGTFGGVFTGEIEIGNISIVDPSKTSGNDAIVTIQHGGNGIKRLQLRDTESSDFAQAIRITDNAYNQVISLGQDGYGLFNGGVTVGNSTKSSVLSNDALTLNGSTIDGSVTGKLNITPTTLNIGTVSSKTNLNVYGSALLNDDVTFNGSIMIGNKLKITSKSNGVDIDFIE